MISRRSMLLGGLAVGAGATLTACGSRQPEAVGDGKLTVGLTYIPNVQFSAFYLGVREGVFKKHGLDVTLRHHGQQEDLWGAVLGGKEDIVFASADEAMVANAGGNDLRTFATSYQTYPLRVMGGDPATLGADPGLDVLNGATLGIPGHFGSSYYAALCAIHRAGLTENEVTLVDIGFTTLSALAAKQVDFAMGFINNEGVQLENQNIASVSIPIFEPGEALLVGPSLIAPGTKVSEDILRAVALGMKEAEEAVVADPQAALDATAEHVPAMAEPEQRATAEKVLAATAELWKRDGQVSVAVDTAAFGRMAEFFAQAGVIEAAPAEAYLDVL
ncbi:ABC transporter substrate-binding protein [Tessaracoccus sp. MC1865]|uniref:ABC transporter substrate-binding protein n=1 Tax=Tessaracoccus sp. MC1865 TaxID=2760310 RepID=UPI001603DAB1|nr:ABC transporter substrate-binding protein [Tessaracoccus sp. MC1865]MBB1483683.1 ABC transporter substrate-binding protein [Tessaracoccus sp. MC1865]QTO36755.1 ABC transporter substrate-binding protein [Tessaracoccus sp. MC1865]